MAVVAVTEKRTRRRIPATRDKPEDTLLIKVWQSFRAVWHTGLAQYTFQEPRRAPRELYEWSPWKAILMRGVVCSYPYILVPASCTDRSRKISLAKRHGQESRRDPEGKLMYRLSKVISFLSHVTVRKNWYFLLIFSFITKIKLKSTVSIGDNNFETDYVEQKSYRRNLFRKILFYGN